MGKFFDALKKAETSRGRPTPESDPRKVVRISNEEIDTLMRLDITAIEQEPGARPPSSGGKIDPRLLTLLDPQSPIAEQFKLLRAKIFCGDSVCRGKAFMVTSPQSFDGKSTVAANLAVTIAQGMDEYVLLVDCDLRQPTVHRIFGAQALNGIREYLENGTSVAPYLQKTQVNKLTLLPAGQPALNPSELLSSEKMRQLVEELKGRYSDRYIIFDTTPAGFAAETNFLSTMVDGVLLVVRSGKTARKLITKAIEHIGRDKILGIVFNGDQESPKKDQYYYRYYQKKK
jgi:protein-tyrosine kinase